MEYAILILSLAFLVSSVALAVYNRNKTKQIMNRIEKMLDDVMKGCFKEEHYDETEISKLETKLAHYLSASVTSENNIRKEKDRIKVLISDISHQTKTPVSNLLLYSELLNELKLSETAKEYVESIHGQTQKLQFLIDSLIKISRLETGIVKLNPETSFINPVLERVFVQYKNKAESKGLAIELKDNEKLMAVFDIKWTEEALGNIVDNAIKYTDAGKIEISAVQYEMFLRVDVSDTGKGISEDEHAKIFSRFYRSCQFSEEEGLGIGLYLSRKIISGEGGYIKVSSFPNKGSKFSVFIPR